MKCEKFGSHIFSCQSLLLGTNVPNDYRDLGTNHNCPYYQGVLLFQVNVYNKAPFGAIIKFMDYAGVIFKHPD